MIELVVSENGRALDRLEFDADTVIQHKRDVVTLHRGINTALLRIGRPLASGRRRVELPGGYRASEEYIQELKIWLFGLHVELTINRRFPNRLAQSVRGGASETTL